jgi:23S rRNA (cytidine2498-2'-O)-methyltransferase
VLGFHGYAKTEKLSGYVLYVCDQAIALNQQLKFSHIIFARQKLLLLAELKNIDPQDRITPVLEALQTSQRFGDLLVETPDTDEHKPLSGLARAFGNALRSALRKQSLLSDKPNPTLPRLHVCVLAGNHLLLAQSQPGDSSDLMGGVPRLRMHADAPSRSALKLEEAFLYLLTEDERKRWLTSGMKAVDLGAAPGGWTWVLTRYGISVSSIDNGPLRQHVMDTGLVNHLREDGFQWHPPKPIDWMVCDMVESPIRVAQRMADWFTNGWCQHSVFNLKLPMKKRWEETHRCLELFAQQVQPKVLRAKQLYHDREEITVFASR